MTVFTNVQRTGTLLAAVALAVLAACSGPETANGILDPHEAKNRGVHQENVKIDRYLYSPVSQAYGDNVGQPIRRGVGNFARNLALPGDVVNNLLQLDIGAALNNTTRFVVNTTIGIGGIFDPAGEIGLEEESADFGQTLYVWGVPEGNYVELPLLGPSTERHMVGRFVDLFTNPLAYVVGPPDAYIGTGATFLTKVDQRYEYSETIDAILYESEDSYAQSRRLYLDTRRFQLGVEASEEEVDELDALFEDLYGE